MDSESWKPDLDPKYPAKEWVKMLEELDLLRTDIILHGWYPVLTNGITNGSDLLSMISHTQQVSKSSYNDSEFLRNPINRVEWSSMSVRTQLILCRKWMEFYTGGNDDTNVFIET